MQDRRSKHRSHKRSTSKRLLKFALFMAVALTALTVGVSFQAEPNPNALNTLTRLTEVWYGLTALVVTAYFWKAKNENRYKYGQAWVANIADKFGWEAAARFFETTVKGD